MGYAVEWPKAEYDEILPNLFLGGHVWVEGGRHKNGRHSQMSQDPSWGYVVSAYLEPRSENAFPRCDNRMVIFDDTEKGLSDDVWEQIRSAVNQAARRWQDGEKVLIRCQAGYNRSGLMMCLVLMILGFTAERAIHQVRWRRGPDVLINSVFERYVHEKENEYLDPTAFEATEALMNRLVPVLK